MLVSRIVRSTETRRGVLAVMIPFVFYELIAILSSFPEMAEVD